MSKVQLASPSDESCRLRARNLASKIAFLTLRDIWPQGENDLWPEWKSLPRRRFKLGSRIHASNNGDQNLIILEEGAVNIYAPRPIRSFVKRVGPGGIFGEMRWLGISMLGTEAEAVRDSSIVALDSVAAEGLIRASPGTQITWIRRVCSRLVTSERDLALALFCDLRTRLASLLLELADADGVVAGVSQEEMGDRVGARRESVTTELGKMKREGLLTVETKKVVILDVEALRALVVF